MAGWLLTRLDLSFQLNLPVRQGTSSYLSLPRTADLLTGAP